MSRASSRPPPPIVKVPLLRRFGGVPPKPYRVGRGYSLGEIQAVGLTVKEARLLGIYVDERRKTVHEENVKRLAEWLEAVKRGEVEPAPPTLPKEIVVKPDRGRVFKGKTMAGRRMRGLLSLKYRYTHHYKWGRKQRERELRKRHEATRHKGGH
ncbi:MAG: hypothetical protein DRK00_02920 [Thermoprotei archaeon]|nr:MAG: hypothetical protein DRK00_02920 [Thermoprotei archaeon]